MVVFFDVSINNLIKLVSNAVSIPVIACGGVGNFSHFSSGILEGGASAVAAGNIFHYTENSYYQAIKFLYENKCNTRPPILSSFNYV